MQQTAPASTLSTSTTQSTTSAQTLTTSSPSTQKNKADKTSPIVNAATSAKRGLSFNTPALTNEFNSPLINWSYNWASDPYYGGYPNNTYNEALEFVPMLWSNATALTSIFTANVKSAESEYGSKHILAFNEPDSCGGGSSCMTPASSAETYKTFIQPFAKKFSLGAPAVTNGVGTGVGASWLTEFLAACPGCTIDFIPIHWYGSVTSPASFKTYVQDFHKQFGKPLWITEFGTTSGTQAQILTFLKNVLPWLDKQAYVQRYAYFMDSAQGSPYLLNTDDSLTNIGKLYNKS